MKAPLPPDEADRLQALLRYEILDTPAEPEFDDIALLAARICGTPIAMISLVDHDRQWFKSRVGLTDEETPRDVAFCAHGILQDGLFIIPDALADPRFAENPIVAGPPNIRFYAGAPLRTPDGHTLGMICVNDRVPRQLNLEQLEALRALSRQVVTQLELRRNLRELKRTMKNLDEARESFQLLSSSVEQLKESILITDAQLDLPGPRIIFVNRAFTAMTGYEAKEVLGRTPRLLQGPATDRAVLDRLRADLTAGRVFAGETVNYRKDGTPFDLEWQIAPIRNAEGVVTHFVAIQRDITARKQMEARLLQAQKMETVGKLAGGIAHEFNTLLTTIIGQSELLAGDLLSGDPRSESARAIQEAAERAGGLTRQLLAYGRGQVLHPETVNLNRIIDGMLDTLRRLAGRDVDIRIATASELKLVRIDPGQMEQVILNLALNAIEAMPRGGNLTIETANMQLDEAYTSPFPGLHPGGYVMLSVSDTGIGMSPEIKARAFEPFFTTKEVGQGAGLGLSTCYGIIRQSHGRITMYSEEARGSTFKIYLPQAEADSRPTPSISSAQLPHGTETILLVEDDETLRDMVASLLRRLGYNVLTATSGDEALNAQTRPGAGPIDLLLADVILPNMGGPELADRLRVSLPGTRVLHTTAYTRTAALQQGLLRADAHLLPKPFTPSELARKVRAVLDEEEPNQP